MPAKAIPICQLLISSSKLRVFPIPFTGNVTKINNNTKNELSFVKFKGNGCGPFDQISGNSGSKSSSAESFENYSLEVLFFFPRIFGNSGKFLVPFAISIRPFLENFAWTKATRQRRVEPAHDCLSYTKTLFSDLLENFGLMVQNFMVGIRAVFINLPREKFASFCHRSKMILERVGQVNIR